MPAELLAQTECSIESPGDTIVSLPILMLNVHEQCNCRCLMCDIWQRKDGKELDLVDFERHRASIMRLGVRQVVLTGGEPLLHRNLEGVFEFLRDCNVSITLLTTGLLLSKRSNVVAANVDEIIVSLDGPEEVHDRVRRVKGAYRLIGEASCLIDTRGDQHICRLTPKGSRPDEAIRSRFLDLVTDENLREKVAAQPAPLRDVIVALAFGALARERDGAG